MHGPIHLLLNYSCGCLGTNPLRVKDRCSFNFCFLYVGLAATDRHRSSSKWSSSKKLSESSTIHRQGASGRSTALIDLHLAIVLHCGNTD